MHELYHGLRLVIRRLMDRNERGQALAEFAVAAPVVFMLLLGLFDAGRLVFINNELSEAAREGARWAAVQGRAANEAAGNDTAVSDIVNERIVVAPAPTITVGCTDLRAGGAACTSGDLVTVSISTSVAPVTPLIGSIIGPMDISAQAQMTVR